jgi:hypothetical protein
MSLAQNLSREEVLKLVYPGTTVKTEYVFLTEDQQLQATEHSGVDVPSALIARYLVSKDSEIVGKAYIDTHTVRTKKETLLIALNTAGEVLQIEVTAFLEPQEYLAPDAWLRQYEGRALNQDLAIHRTIRPIAGATLTAQATNEAVRRILAIDEILKEKQESP